MGKRFSSFAALVAACTAASCAGRQAPKTRGDAKFDLVKPFTEAAEIEQIRGAKAATAAYLDLLDQSLDHSAAPHATWATVAAVDALVHHSNVTLARISNDHALAFRHPGGMKLVAERLEKAYAAANAAGPFARGVIADGGLALAMHEGDAARAQKWRARTGCARAATVIGPLEWGPITAVGHETPVEKPGAPLAASYAGIKPFVASVPPTVVPADGCDVSLLTTSVLDGLRAVVVDVDVPKAQTIGISLRSTSAATLVVGGKTALVRGYELGGGRVQKWATAHVDKGKVRIVARVGANGEGTRVRLDFFGEDGMPLTTHAPNPGDLAPLTPDRADEVALRGDRSSQAEMSLIAAAMLALGDGRSAEHLLEEGNKSGMSPLAALLYTRAVDEASDLPENRAIERQRDAFESALKAWPSSWEAVLGHAQLTGRRRGASEGRIEALRELARVRGDQRDLDPLVSAYEAATAAEGRLFDVAETSYQSAKTAFGGTPFLAELDDAVHDRTGREREQHACRTEAGDRSSLDCAEAKIARGDRRGALAEIARLRVLRDSPRALSQFELAQYIALGDEAGMKVYLSLFPAERTLASLGLLLSRSPAELKARLASDMLAAADSPGALAGLSTSLLDSPAPALESEGLSRVAADRKTRSLTNAATAVLRHIERYTINEGGLLRYTLYDLRRVSGTTDVEQGAQGASAIIEGRDVRRILRRRIHKPDGRVLEPDKASYASQEHADLSQLEKGDYVEQIVEGWAMPGAAGQLVVDTPDLLPERTSLEEASIEIRRPQGLELAIWSHAQLGKRTERVEGNQKITTLTIKDHPPRRLEEGVPRMDRDAAVSFGTSSWQVVGRSIAEAIASLDDKDPYVSKWARSAARGTKEDAPRPASDAPAEAAVTQRAIVDRIAMAAGKSVKVASGSVLSDLAGALSAGAQGTTARTILELGQGSRSWLAFRALRELGIPAEIVVAERNPFSADPHYPPRFGRFDYPLVLAHTKEGDVWLDLDVAGPPLPAGRVSPELRGRVAMNAKGDTLRVGGTSMDEARDEVDLRLKLDERGNAKGTFTILLRGRTAQALADSLEKVVGSDRNDMLRQVVLGWVPWANVDEVGLSSSEGSWQVSLRALVTIPGYAQAEGASWVLPGFEPLHVGFPRAYVGTLGATFASQGARESALAIDSAFQYHVHRRVELDPAFQTIGTLPAVEQKDDNLEALRRGKLESGVLEEDFALSLATGTLDTESYGKFAENAHRIDDGFQAATRVARGGPPTTDGAKGAKPAKAAKPTPSAKPTPAATPAPKKP
jgi:hypothetical protein